MTNLFGLPINTLTTVLLIATGAIIVAVVALALVNAIFFKIGVRNIPRRRVQMVLIVFALMLSTTLLSSVLATGDVILGAEQTVAVYNLGNVDEVIQTRHGDPGFFPDYIYYVLRYRVHDPDIAAVSAALVEPDLLVADETSRQVRSQVSGIGVIPPSEQGFGGMQEAHGKKRLTITALKTNQVYLNQSLAALLNAHPGDTLYLYDQRWPGQRYRMRVANITADGGLDGDAPALLANIQTFRGIENREDDITKVYIENKGGGGVSGINLSDSVTDTLNRIIPGELQIFEVKEQGVQDSQLANDVFTRVFTLFSLFALAISLLLIFLIFVLLAAERRREMGMARAIGVQRRHLVLMFLFEGAVYDFLASLVGLIAGVGLGALLVIILQPLLAAFNFPLKPTFQLRSFEIAYCLGVIFTFCSVTLSAWLVSRMTVVDAIRDLPEPSGAAHSLRERFAHERDLWRAGCAARARELAPDLLIALLRSLVLTGIAPLILGYIFLHIGLNDSLIAYFSLGLSLLIVGAGLLLKTCIVAVLRGAQRGQAVANRLFAALAGLALLAYWALPFDVLANLGLPRFQGGIEIFFIAGVMMVLGAVWALITNASLIVRPLLAGIARLPRLYALGRLASAYPLHRRFRTGLSIIMFSLVVFVMTVMAVITYAMQNSYANVEVQTGGYDIQAIPFFQPIPNIQSEMLKHGIDPDEFAAIGEQTSTAVGVIQLSSPNPGWNIYPAQVVNGSFLQGLGLKLTARARGFNSDAAVWQALQTHPNYALIDSTAVPYNLDQSAPPVYDPNAPTASQAGIQVDPPGFDAPNVEPYIFSLSGVYQGETSFPATPVWVTSGVPTPNLSSSEVVFASTHVTKLTIIGVVDNSDGNHFGLYIPSAAFNGFADNEANAAQSSPEAQTFYFKVARGQDAHALALQLGSAFLDNGLQTTVLQDAVLQVQGPRIFLSNVLLGIVGLTLLLGVLALAITGTRAVVERRQQIGMLRALGCGRLQVQAAFLLESFLVGAIGSILGVVLGLILSSNIFAANFFEQFNTDLVFAIPYHELGIVIGAALLASFLGALLPAWQAGRVQPAEALRYQ
jgi:putative ABC transport system permease protein